MADTENREDQKISECLREAFGYSDDQLLKQLDQANETFKDVNFTGAEDRLMKRFLARKAELEKETASQTPTLVPQNESANIQIAEELPKKTVTVISEAEEKKKNEKKVIRFGKKKVLATAALVAVIAGMLGGTAIGRKSYFFRHSEKISNTIVVDNDNNKAEVSKLENAYADIADKYEDATLKLKYYPQNMHYESHQIYKDEAQINFIYGDKTFTVYMIKNDESTSVNFESDRKNKKTIFNKWLNKDIVYSENVLEDKKTEYEAMIVVNHVVYYIIGTMPESEFEKILKNLIYFKKMVTFSFFLRFK